MAQATQYWRMAMRDGSNGDDMFPLCFDHQVAAITYDNLAHIDLTPYSRDHKPDEWRVQKGFSPGFMASFAFDVAGGDVIFVKSSEGGRIVGRGVVRGRAGARAYRFDDKSPIVTKSGHAWRHLVDVDWEPDFASFVFDNHAPIQTVRRLTDGEVAYLYGIRPAAPKAVQPASVGDTNSTSPLSEKDYLQRVVASERRVTPAHKILSNAFVKWLRSHHALHGLQEQNCLDVTFSMGTGRVMAELKICYGGNTRAAIREALGQLLEYNLREGRKSHDQWLLVLDLPPGKDDIAFVGRLRSAHQLPISLCWPDGASGFKSSERGLFGKSKPQV